MSKGKIFVPELRFPEFDNEWEHKKLSKIVTRVIRKNRNEETNLPLTISAEYGLVDQSDFFKRYVASKDMSGYYLLKKGEFAYNKSYSNGNPWGVVRKLIKYDKGALSSLYICFKPNIGFDSDFIEQYFLTNVWHKEISMIAVEGARNHGLLNISISDFFESIHIYPDYEEQKKIAVFLALIDKKIELLEKKVELLEEQNLGLFQKIFSQEIRFKKDDGSDFEDWKYVTLDKLIRLIGGYAFKSQDYTENGSHYVITIGNVQSGKMVITENTKKINVSKSMPENIRLNNEDIVVSLTGNVGRVCKVNVVNGLLNQRVAKIECNDSMIKDFLYIVLNNKVFCDSMIRKGQGGAQANISNKDIYGFSVHLPSSEEQTIIADFLNKHNLMIDRMKLKIENVKKLKEGLLNKMFL